YFEGFLYAPKDGEYRFILESDDGAILKINDIILVDNDGSHSLKKAEGEIKLKKGYHHFELGYFDDYDEQELRLYWAVPGSPFQIIESSFFFSNNP
nr:nucleotide pyrophosphatase [Sunxiuqinia sp.]